MFDQDVQSRPQFRIFGVPVTITLWHLFVLVMVASSMHFDERSWPLPSDRMLLYAGVMLVTSLSVLLHELGHAFVSLYMGLQPEVVLSGLGGFTRHQPATRPRNDFLIVAMGPSVNLVIAAVCLYAGPQHAATIPDHLIAFAGQANLFWAIYNLLPIVPLDGGQLTRIVMRRLFRSQISADRLTFRLGLGLATILAALSLYAGQIFGLIILGMAAFQNWQLLKMLADQPEARSEQSHPRVRELVELARQAFAAGQYEEASRFCHQARAEPYLSKEELQHIWHLLAVSAARQEVWEEALRFAERVPGSADMAQIQAVALLALGDAQRARRFLSTPAAVLLPAERVGALQELARELG